MNKKAAATNLCLVFCRDLNKMADGMGSKFGRLIYSFVAFISGYCLGFVYLWQMTFVMLAFLPVVAISAGIIAKVDILPSPSNWQNLTACLAFSKW